MFTRQILWKKWEIKKWEIKAYYNYTEFQQFSEIYYKYSCVPLGT